MHLPDGVLPVREWLPLAVVAGAVVTVATQRARAVLEHRQVPLVGFLAASVLVVQMANFPLIGGTSGHLTGTVLLVFVAGPEVAAMAMASVLALQALAFHDGGLLAIGANYVNMVVVPSLFAAAALAITCQSARLRRHVSIVAGASAWLGAIVGAASCALQLGLADVVPLRTALSWMCGGHAVVGLVEGLLTAAVISALDRRGIGAFCSTPAPVPSRSRLLGSVFAVAAVAAIVIPFASQRPDVLQSLLTHR